MGKRLFLYLLIFVLFGLQIVYAEDDSIITENEIVHSADSFIESEVEKFNTSFAETELYSQITQLLDKSFEDFDHEYWYDEDNRELLVYIAVSQGMRDALLADYSNLSQSWTKVTEFLSSSNDSLGLVMSLSSPNGTHPNTNKTITYIVVDSLKENRQYYPQDISCVIQNGTIIYNVADDVKKATIKYVNSSLSKDSVDQNSEANNSATTEQKNALQSAKRYLDIIPFSRQGLIEQLEYEGYSHSSAIFAVDHCNADWNEQAARSAKKYMEVMSFSRSGLIEQLEYEGYTHEQAEYGVKQNGY